MTASRREASPIYSLSYQISAIVVLGVIITAAMVFWLSVPVVKRLAEMAGDAKQIELVGETRLHLVELYKLRRTVLEQNLRNCDRDGALDACLVTVGLGGVASNKAPVKENIDGGFKNDEARVEWPSETTVIFKKGANSWSFVLPITPW